MYKFWWDENLYKFFWFYSGLDWAPLLFRKILKIIIALLGTIDARIVIFLGNILLILKTLVKIIQARKALVILLQNLGFVINVKNPQLAPVKEIEFLGGSDNRFKNSDTYLTTPHLLGPPFSPPLP